MSVSKELTFENVSKEPTFENVSKEPTFEDRLLRMSLLRLSKADF